MNKTFYPETHEITYLEADVNYTIFHLQNRHKLISSTTLKRHENNFNLNSFLRISKSHLVNPVFIENIEKKGKYTSVIMTDGKRLKVSRRKRAVLGI